MTVLNPLPACCIPSEQFWCRGALYVSVTHATGVTELVIDRPYAIIGSHPQADVRLPQAGIPKRALFLYISADGIFCRSLEKEYPGIGKGIYLLPEDVLNIDGYQLQVRAQVPEPLYEDESPAPATIQRVPELAVVPGEGKRYKRRMDEPLLLVGRNRTCDLRLPEGSVSACHCALLWHEQQLWVIDLLSGNGTLYNHEKFECLYLNFGEFIEVGAHRLVLYRLYDPQPIPAHNAETVNVSAHTKTIHETQSPVVRAPAKPENASPAESVVANATFVSDHAHAVAEQDSISPAKWLELQAAYEQSQTSVVALQHELQATQTKLQQVQTTCEHLREEVTSAQQARDAAQQSRQELSVLNERLAGEITNLQQIVHKQNQTLAEQSESHANVLGQLQNERNRLSEHLAASVQQFTALNQAFGQMQSLVNELRAEKERKRELPEDHELALKPTKKKNVSLLQPQMGILLRPTPAMRITHSAGNNSSLVNSDHDMSVVDAASSNASETPLMTETVDGTFTTPVRGKTRADQDEKLTHFVSDRLGQIESNRRFTILIIWLVTFLFTALLLVGIAILLKSFDTPPLAP